MGVERSGRKSSKGGQVHKGRVEQNKTTKRSFFRYGLTSLTRRILFLNIFGLIVLVSGILYLNQFRAGLIDARVQSLLTQGKIIAGAIGTSASVDLDSIIVDPDRLIELKAGESLAPSDEELSGLEFPINPERAAPVLRRLISPTKTRARIYDREGVLIVDSRNLSLQGQVLQYDLPPPQEKREKSLESMITGLIDRIFSHDLPVYKELSPEKGKEYPEVRSALGGSPVALVRVNEKNELIVSVAVPVQRFRAVLGALVLSTRGGDIDAIVSAERTAIFRVFLVAAAVTMLLSFLLAGTIAEPVRRLAEAAERVRRGTNTREEIPDFTKRSDELGHLSGALREMTTALYNRIDAIESFAADVAHELKNPLTSLRSAVETLPLIKDKDQQERLLGIIQQDIGRLDRLISDISDASRLDAELAREEYEPVDVLRLLETITTMQNEVRGENAAKIELIYSDDDVDAYWVNGNASRLGQVVSNLVANALSFSPESGLVSVELNKNDNIITFSVSDQGPGILPDNLEKVFDRFHTDRPGEANFGKNSGLGLSISKQIIDSHEGQIWAENIEKMSRKDGKNVKVTGARFIVELPAFSSKKKTKRSQ